MSSPRINGLVYERYHSIEPWMERFRRFRVQYTCNLDLVVPVVELELPLTGRRAEFLSQVS